jgi:hypothetical protein
LIYFIIDMYIYIYIYIYIYKEREREREREGGRGSELRLLNNFVKNIIFSNYGLQYIRLFNNSGVCPNCIFLVVDFE